MSTAAELQEAIGARSVEKIQQLLLDNPALAQDRLPSGASPLLFAAYMRAPEVIAAVRRFASIDAFAAAALGDTDALRTALVRDPSAVQARSGDGWTALHLAGFFGQLEAVELLLSRGASVSALSANRDANQPLQAAAAGGAAPAVVSALLAAGADPNAVAPTGFTALHSAANRGDAAMVDLLLAHGSNPSARMDDGRTPADIARERGHTAIGEKLQARMSSRPAERGEPGSAHPDVLSPA